MADFIKAALPWIAMGIAVAVVLKRQSELEEVEK